MSLTNWNHVRCTRGDNNRVGYAATLTTFKGFILPVTCFGTWHQAQWMRRVAWPRLRWKHIVAGSPCQLPLQNLDNLGARAPNRLFFYYALFLSWKLVFRFYRVLISCFWLYRGPLLGLWTKYHRDGGSDSIGGNILLKKTDFVEGVIFVTKLSK